MKTRRVVKADVTSTSERKVITMATKKAKKSTKRGAAKTTAKRGRGGAKSSKC